MRATFELSSGGRAEVVDTDGDHVVLRSTVAAPPGSPLDGQWAERGGRIRIKVRGCRRESGEGELFRIEGRFVNLGKAQRAALVGSTASRGEG